MNHEEKTLEKDYRYRGRIINVRLDVALMPDGTTTSYREVVEHPGGVVIALEDENGLFSMVTQWRYAQEYLLPEGAEKIHRQYHQSLKLKESYDSTVPGLSLCRLRLIMQVSLAHLLVFSSLALYQDNC